MYRPEEGVGLPFKSGTRSPVIGVQIKSLNAEIKHSICLTTIFLPLAGEYTGVVIILNDDCHETPRTGWLPLSMPYHLILPVIEMNR